jgi:hypothetical protein
VRSPQPSLRRVPRAPAQQPNNRVNLLKQRPCKQAPRRVAPSARQTPAAFSRCRHSRLLPPRSPLACLPLPSPSGSPPHITEGGINFPRPSFNYSRSLRPSSLSPVSYCPSCSAFTRCAAPNGGGGWCRRALPDCVLSVPWSLGRRHSGAPRVAYNLCELGLSGCCPRHRAAPARYKGAGATRPASVLEGCPRGAPAAGGPGGGPPKRASDREGSACNLAIRRPPCRRRHAKFLVLGGCCGAPCTEPSSPPLPRAIRALPRCWSACSPPQAALVIEAMQHG